MKDLFRPSLQFFAEGEPAPTQGKVGEAPPAAVPPAPPVELAEKTFTQQQMSDLVARESRTAVENALAEVGFEGKGNHKEQMEAFKTWQDSQKTELDKALEQVKTAETTHTELTAKYALLEQTNIVLGAGVPADKVTDYVAMANARTNEETDFTAALKKTMEVFPAQTSQTNQPLSSFGGKSGGESGETADPFLEGFKKGL